MTEEEKIMQPKRIKSKNNGIFENRRLPQKKYAIKSKINNILKMEDDLNYFLKKEYDLNILKMDNNLKK
jgi:hypothetical protein